MFQTILEEELVELVRPFAEETKLRNLCLAGGIFANVKANAALFRALEFENVYIFPNMGDGGLGCGAALELMQAEPTPFDSVYWGPGQTEAEIEAALRDKASEGVRYQRYDDVERQIAQLLADGKVVARFNGRMEFGPRALCNRTILYAANEPEANTWLNKRLGRTEFMPFAPVALQERAEKLFLDMKGTEHALKFMTIILECTEFTKENCPAVVHVDGTARPQLVSRPRSTRACMQDPHELRGADRRAAARQHQLQHARGADRLHAGGRRARLPRLEARLPGDGPVHRLPGRRRTPARGRRARRREVRV